MSLLQIIVLAAVQGLAELLPVSSSAHVIVAEKLMGLDPTQPRDDPAAGDACTRAPCSPSSSTFGKPGRTFLPSARDSRAPF